MSRRSAKVVVETGSDFGANKGDEAYFAAMVDLFAEMLPEVEIVKFDGRPEMIRERYGVRAVYSGGNPKRRLKALWPTVREIATADAYCWGGGQILLDEHGFISVPYRLSRPMFARLLGKPVMSYAVGVGPLTGRFCRWLARWCLDRFTLVTVRDDLSVRILRGCGVRRPIVRTVDAAIALRPADPARAEEILRAEGVPPGRPIVTYLPWGPAYRVQKSLLPVIFRKGQAVRDERRRRLYERHCRVVGEALRRFAEATGAFVLFVPPDPFSAHGGDGIMARDIAARMGAPDDGAVITGEYSPKELKALLGRAELAVGSRMHGLILSAGEGVPIVAVCFNDKTRDFCRIMGQERWMIEESEVTGPDAFLRFLLGAWSERGRLRREVSARRDELVREVRANVERLGRLLRRGRA